MTKRSIKLLSIKNAELRIKKIKFKDISNPKKLKVYEIAFPIPTPPQWVKLYWTKRRKKRSGG